MICFQCVDEHERLPWGHPWRSFPTDLPLGGWAIHRLSHSAPELLMLLMRVGFIDAEEEGGIAFWRWDPWNAKMAGALRRLRRETRESLAEVRRVYESLEG